MLVAEATSGGEFNPDALAADKPFAREIVWGDTAARAVGTEDAAGVYGDSLIPGGRQYK
jgi:hypothetical protein